MTNISKKTWLKISAIALACALVLVSVFFIVKDIIRENELDTIQKQAITELERYDGQYDTQSIVLRNTNPGTAKLLAEKLGAKLRITSNGSFATLTLPEGVTVEDIYRNDENRELLEKFSLDLYASVSDIGDEDTDEDESVEVHPVASPRYTVNDTLYSNQSYLDYLNMQNVWDSYKGNGITVAVIDTGIDTDHPEFAGKISNYSYNATEDKIVKDYGNDWSLVEDVQGHGTSVAGVIAASMDGEGIVGIAPNVTLIVIKCECSEDGSFLRSSDLVFGLYYAIERDADVVNMSFGGPDVFSEALRLAVDSDVICVAAAGNEATSGLTYPAADPNCIGVGALADGSWELSAYSNFGDNSDIVAPGTVYTTAIGGTYRTIDGTSFSSPIVAASVALLREQNWNMEFEDVVELLYASSYDLGGLGEDFYYGYGALDISALILEERGKVTFDMLTDEVDDLEYVFIRNHTLQTIPEPERLYAVFDGWYYDIHVEDELNWYTDKFTSDLTLYANWGNEDDVIPYTYVILDDGTVEIRSYTGHRRYITIPDKIEGRIVSSIGDFAFLGQTRLREINLPSGLVNIGLQAFANCSNLTEMAIPDGVKTIGAYTFENDARLYEVTFGSLSKLTTIGNGAFQNCGLLAFELPQNVTSVNGSAFVGCTSLMNFTVRKGNTSFTAANGVLYNKTKSAIVAYPAGKTAKTFTVPDETTMIGVYSFYCAKINEIDFANTEIIGEESFTLSSLTKVNMPDKIISVGKGAFASCANLTDVKLSSSLTSIEAGTFAYCTSLPSITIPKKVQALCEASFRGCSSLMTAIFEEGSELVLIDSKTFYMNDLRSIDIPSGVVVIGADAFALNYNLSSVTFAENSVLNTIGGGNNFESTGTGAFYGCTSLKSISLPESLETIGAFAFEESGLTEVTISKNVSSLGVGAFASCHRLENIFVDDANTNYIDIDGVVYTSDKTVIYEYPAGRKDTSYVIENTVTKIGDCAFYGSWNLTGVTLPQKLETVGEYGFYDCENIYTYNLPESLTYIERYAFSNNINLAYLNIPDNVIQISNYAFAYDYNCTSISFNDTSKLPRISFAAFAYTGITSFRVPPNVSTMAQYAFEGCTNLNSVTFAENSKLESISAYLFDGVDELQSIKFENGSLLTSVQAHAFEGLRKLKSVDFGDAKLENIDNYAFRYDESLQTLNIPDTVTNIGRYAFYGDKNLTTLYIPASVEGIGRFAFYGAENLNLYFLGDALPLHLQENWDNGILGYYVDVAEVLTSGDWQYAKLKSGNIAIIAYTGSETSVDLTKLDFGGSITQIGGYAFAYTDVTSIKLPETLELIQRYAFAQSKLMNITIPKNVEFIGQYAFVSTPITNVTFASGSKLYKIEQYAFAHTKQLKTVSIPENVTVLESYAFFESGIESVSFAKNCKIDKINPHTFASSALKTVTIPDSVNYIDDNAFRDCLMLKTISFSKADNLQIHANVFYNTGLSTLTIPANVEYIGEYAFVGLENLSAYNVDAGNEYYKSVDGVLYSKDGRKLIAFPAGKTGTFKVPATVETIGFGAFENTKLSSVTFADGINLLTIGYRAFYNAKNIVQIDIPASVVSIDYYAFAMCGSLETVNFAKDNHLTGIYEGAFYSDKSLKNITLPDSIVEISDYAFYGCVSLDKLPITENNQLKGIYSYAFAFTGIKGEINIPETVTDLGEYCFRGTGITSFTVPRTNEKKLLIGIGALQDCDKIETIDIPFAGATYMDEEITWFTYIFGAGSVEASETYLPQSLKNIALHTTACSDCSYIFGTTSSINYLCNIETIGLPDGLTSIGELAFYNCSSLTSINIPDGVTSIGGYAFSGCSSLTSINIPDGVTSIGGYAFSGCSSLTSINIPDGVTSIGGYAFYNCSSLTSITIPDSVMSIAYGAFEGCSSLTSINIPDGVTSIGDHAFRNCSSLTSITIPDSVTSIYGYVFQDCSSLTSINIPDGVTSIGEWAFYGCSSLTSINIPNSVTSIGDRAFKCCDKLYIIYNNSDLDFTIGSEDNGYIAYYAKILIDKNGNKTYRDSGSDFTYVDTPDGFRFMLENGEYTLIAYLGVEDTVTLPKDINGHRYTIYQLCGVKNVIIPDSMTSISDYAFYDCSSLTSVTIPDSVTIIGDCTFYDCSSLISISIPDSVTSIGRSAFSGCSNLKSINIPDSVTSFPYMTFYGCSSLTSITIPDSVTSIGYMAFRNCNSLTSITIPDSVTSIGDYAFSGCTGLTSIYIPKNVSNIISNAFLNCSKLSASVAEDNPYFMEKDGVIYNKEGTEILLVLPGRMGEIVLLDGITTIPYHAFEGQNGITSITIPDSVTSIGDGAFWNCNSITSITIPDSVTSINNYMFYNCNSLVNITIPDSITNIGDWTFYDCSSLTSITIPHGVTRIGSSAFSGCSGLTSITIPDSVTSIGDDAFYKCSSLTNITIPDSVTSIEREAFHSCSSLTRINIPDGVTSIGRSAFSGCSSLTSITIPDGVTSIGEWAFSGCSSLTSITIPDGVTSIGGYAFSGCSSLTSINIPDGVTSIGGYAFSGCSSLTSITIPNRVTSIGNRAFYDCEKLYVIYNNSNLDLTFGSEENGHIAYYAKIIVDKNKSKTYRDPGSDFAYVDTPDGFRFTYENGEYTLIAYLGSQDTVTLPKEINGCNYSIYKLCNVRNVIVPDGITRISPQAFFNCNTLTSVVISNSVTSIGVLALSGCSSLTSITIPNSVTDIEWGAFSGCSSLTSITIPDSVTYIGSGAFTETPFYQNEAKLENGVLHVGNYLIKIPEDTKKAVLDFEIIGMESHAFDRCYQLEELCISGKMMSYIVKCTNLKTLILTDFEDEYFYSVPITLKNIVLKHGCDVRSAYAFNRITGVTIFVEDPEIAVPWDHDYPGWSNGNRVYYGGEWISCEWYDVDGNWIDTSYQPTAQIIRQPYVGEVVKGTKKLVFVGWDIDGDGKADCVPATSSKNIVARAVMKEVDNICTVNFYGFNGDVISSKDYIYGDTIVLPKNPTKKGYTFNGWQSYTAGMTVTENVDFYGIWVHEGTGHNYVKTTVKATCDEQGYDKYVCSICGDEYHDNFTDAKGHTYGSWIVDKKESCTEDGSHHHICTVCTHREDEVIPAHGHTYKVTKETPATCTTVGQRTYECSYCHDVVTENIPESQHNYFKKSTSREWLDALKERLTSMFYAYDGSNAIYYECAVCGHVMTYDESISLMSVSVSETCAHELGDWTITLQPSCADGIEERICTKCHKTIEARVLPATGEGHTYGEWMQIKAPTCIEKGVEHRVCIGCHSEETREIKAIGHSYGTPTYTWNGDECTAKRVCTHDASHIETETVTGIYVKDTSATCTVNEKGHYEATFKNTAFAKQTTTKNGVEKANTKLGHSFTNYVSDGNATCTADGTKTAHCDHVGCSETKTVTDTGSKLGHNYEWVIDKAATKTSTGIKHEECTRCHVKRNENTVIPILSCDHAKAQHIAGKSATCTVTGTKEYWYCAECGKYFSDSDCQLQITESISTWKIIPAIGHSYGAPTYTWNGDKCTAKRVCTHDASHIETETVTGTYVKDTSATCTVNEKGHYEAIFKNTAFAKQTTTKNSVEKANTKLGHSFTNYVSDGNATCTADGTKTAHCDHVGCGETKTVTDTGSKLGHNYEWVIDKAATKTSTGIKHEECTRCHVKRNENTIIPILSCDHAKAQRIAGKSATCTVTGTKEYWYCAECGKYFSDSACQLQITESISTWKVIPATGHSYGEWYETKAPKCVDKGEERRDCIHCDHCETREVPATGIHTPSSPVRENEVAATATTDGGYDEVVYCTECHAELSRTHHTIPATGETEKRGDLNGDGVVNTADAIHLLRHVMFPARYPISQSGDMNGDGAINTADAIQLLRHVMFPARYPLAEDGKKKKTA